MKLRKSFQEQVASLMVMHICLMQCKNMIVSTNSFFYNLNSILNVGVLILIFASYLRFFVKNKAYSFMSMKAFLAVFAILIFWFFSYLLDNQLFVNTEFPYSYVRRQALTCISYSIPLFVLSSYLDGAGLLLKKLYSVAPIVFGVSLFSFFSYMFSSADVVTRGYSMSFGNQMLLGAAILLFKFLDDGKYRDLMMFVIIVFLIVASGSRGPLVSILCFIVYAMFKVKKNRTNVTLLALLSVMMCGSLLFMDTLLQLLTNVFDALGINSRTFSMLLNGNILYTSGRNEYHEALLAAINEHPLIGLGAFGGEKTVGLAHSLYIDIFANFGYLLGTLFIVVLAIKIICYLFKNPNTPRATLIIMFSLLIFPRGFFDETFWAAWYMWIIMGLLIRSGKPSIRSNTERIERIVS